ncbi:glutaredoxin family protein [Hoyosella sp. G463]|uniref:Glutaredoxin family protein n=1 Tax=Lolliginicoccus lacisalsi TaxID=2742202 RepID=A0A927JB49_9ACTN|nr:glutaredoxin family protein [Lolliginicoccus lacisalsi]MBD8505934.1 glutaredoxin family protein [Lolliginicoccus lacisalsi]
MLLGRAGCSACVAARAALEEVLEPLGLAFEEVDVDEAAARDPELREEYGDRVPVVLLNGVEHSYGEVDVDRLRADLVM